MTGIDYQSFMAFEVKETDDYSELSIKIEDLGDFLHPENVYIIIHQDIKKIYLWKGARSIVRKRFLGSRIATEIQGDMMKTGFNRCKIVSVDQGDEIEEFLNVFGLESMKVAEVLEDKRYVRNIEREENRVTNILSTKAETSLKIGEIKNLLDSDEHILWNKSSLTLLQDNWVKILLKNKGYKRRLKKTSEASKLEIKECKNTYVVTNKKIISHSIYNKYSDFSDIPKYAFEIKGEGEIVLLDQRELRSFEIEENNGNYGVWFNSEPIDKGDYVFPFENLTSEEYVRLVDSLDKNYIAEIPEKTKKITYIRKKK